MKGKERGSRRGRGRIKDEWQKRREGEKGKSLCVEEEREEEEAITIRSGENRKNGRKIKGRGDEWRELTTSKE